MMRPIINPNLLFTIATLLKQISQIFVPVIVTRELASDEFAAYRLMWLVIGTLIAITELNIPSNLSYFLPSFKDRLMKSRYVWANCFILLVISSVGSLGCYLIIEHLMNNKILSDNSVDISIFMFFWFFGMLIEWIPLSDNDIYWQAKMSILLTVLRIAGICIASYMFSSLFAIVVALIVVSAFRVFLILHYSTKRFDSPGKFAFDDVKKILIYSVPFGIASGLFLMRSQIQSWIAAFVFTDEQFASFSLALGMIPAIGLFNVLLINMFFPKLSKFKSENDRSGLLNGIRAQTGCSAFLTFPMMVYLWSEAKTVISLLFTETYIEAANVMQILIIGVLPQIFQSSLLLRLYGMGKSAMKVDLCMIPIVCIVSYTGSKLFGLPGVAIGSVISLYISHTWCLRLGMGKVDANFFELYDTGMMLRIFLMAVAAVLVTSYIDIEFIDNIYGIFFLKSLCFGVLYLLFTFGTKSVPALLLDGTIEFFRKKSR